MTGISKRGLRLGAICILGTGVSLVFSSPVALGNLKGILRPHPSSRSQSANEKTKEKTEDKEAEKQRPGIFDLDQDEDSDDEYSYEDSDFVGMPICRRNEGVSRQAEVLNGQMSDLRATSKDCGRDDVMNFGILVKNKYFTILRSTGLGKEGLAHLDQHLKGLNIPFPKRIIYLNTYGYKQTPVDSVKKVWSKFQEKVLRKNKKFHTGLFAVEEALLGSKYGYEFFHPGNSNTYLTGTDLEEKARQPKKVKTYSVERVGDSEAFFHVIRLVLEHGGSPILFHCKGGIHRTGMTALLLRYIQGGDWVTPFDEPMEREIKRDGKKARVYLRNPAEYEYYQHNQNNFRAENLTLIHTLFMTDRRFQCLRDKFGPYLRASSDNPLEFSCYDPHPLGEDREHLQEELSPEIRAKWIDECSKVSQ